MPDPEDKYDEIKRRSTKEKFPLTVNERRTALENYYNVTCLRSAATKGIEPYEELKSILFYGENGFVLAHVPGDSRVDEEVLAKEVGPIRIVPKNDLAKYGLEKGRVNPFTAELYLGDKLIHVICHSVFQNEFVHTNNDRVGGWISFRPQDVLHWVSRVRVHPISKPLKPAR